MLKTATFALDDNCCSQFPSAESLMPEKADHRLPLAGRRYKHRFGIVEEPLLDAIRQGLSGHAEMVVGTNDTAPRVGSGRIAVLATPVMINLIEEAALAAVEHLLPIGMQSLGTHLDVSHLAATPIGMTVRAQADLISVDGRKLQFVVRAHDELDLIGEGRHERVVVTAAKFQARVDEKASRPNRS